MAAGSDPIACGSSLAFDLGKGLSERHSSALSVLKSEHSVMSMQALKSERTQDVLMDILLGSGQLYEALCKQAGQGGEARLK